MMACRLARRAARVSSTGGGVVDKSSSISGSGSLAGGGGVGGLVDMDGVGVTLRLAGEILEISVISDSNRRQFVLTLLLRVLRRPSGLSGDGRGRCPKYALIHCGLGEISMNCDDEESENESGHHLCDAYCCPYLFPCPCPDRRADLYRAYGGCRAAIQGDSDPARCLDSCLLVASRRIPDSSLASCRSPSDERPSSLAAPPSLSPAWSPEHRCAHP